MVRLELNIPGLQDELRASGFPMTYCQLLLRSSKTQLLRVLSSLLQPECGVTVVVVNDARRDMPAGMSVPSSNGDVDVYYSDSSADLQSFLSMDAERIIFVRGRYTELSEAIARVGKPWWKHRTGSIEGAIAAHLHAGELLLMLGSDDEGLESVGPRDAILKAAQSIVDALQHVPD